MNLDGRDKVHHTRTELNQLIKAVFLFGIGNSPFFKCLGQLSIFWIGINNITMVFQEQSKNSLEVSKLALSSKPQSRQKQNWPFLSMGQTN